MLGDSTIFPKKVKAMETASRPFSKYVVSQMHCHLGIPSWVGAENVVVFHGLKQPFKEQIILTSYYFVLSNGRKLLKIYFHI